MPPKPPRGVALMRVLGVVLRGVEVVRFVDDVLLDEKYERVEFDDQCHEPQLRLRQGCGCGAGVPSGLSFGAAG